MRRDSVLTKPLRSSFLSCEKDTETIIKKLFVTSNPHSEDLKRLLIINTKDCLDKSNENYKKIVENTSVKELIEGKYIKLVPKVQLSEHEEIKSYIIISFDDFVPTTNPEFRDCMVSFDIMCFTDVWELGDYQLRPFKIAGIIDGILNDTKLSGIGTLKFLAGGYVPYTENLSGYTLQYLATHGSDDLIEGE